jgi:hypothetical protein
MATNGRFKVNHGDVFPHGAYVISDVEPVRDWEKSTPQKAVQAVDKESGLLVWAVSVLDPDPDARKDAKTITVKISAPVQPVPPEAMPGVPFRPVEFDGLTVTPYLDDKRNRVAYSFRASGMRAPHTGSKPAPRAQDAA